MNITKQFKLLVDNLLFSYSMLIFIRSRLVGVMLVGITLLNLNLAFSGIISWITTLIFARLIGIRKNDLVHTIYTYNSLIVGFAIGFLFKISMLSLLMTIGTSVLTVMLSHALYSILTYTYKLPVLNIPFFLVSTIIYLASSRYSSLFVDSFYSFEGLNIDYLPLFLQGLFRTTGTIMFMPYDITGILILIALFCFSTISFFLCVTSYYFGIWCLALLKGSFYHVYFNFSSFNFILIGIALGGIFLIPSRRSYLIALTGVFISVFILDAVSVVWSVFRIPVLTLPFNIVVLLFIYVLRNIDFPFMNNYLQDSPEKSLSIYLNFTRRFDRITPQPNLPFIGEWTVYQSFEGEWTHQGSWKYAYDFVITDTNQQTYQNQGLSLTDYYCFEKPILSPIGGTVIDAYDGYKDNPIGAVDKHHNWGNYIIIYSPFGYYVEISHLQEQSLKVQKGQTVTTGMVLGNCGNSGYSPQPHIHMQLQYWPRLGSETIYFYYSNCMTSEKVILGNTILEQNTQIEPLTFSRKLNAILTFILDDTFIYKLVINDKMIKIITLVVKMAPDGTYYFDCKETNDKLFFGIEHQRFVLYTLDGKKDSPLAYIFAAMPFIPICIDKDMTWHAILPSNILFPIRGYQLFLQSFNHALHQVSGTYHFSNNNREIHGDILFHKYHVQTNLVFNDLKGVQEVQLKFANTHIKLELIDPNTEVTP